MAYKPLPSQLKCAKNRAQYQAMVGGLGSGKTTYGCYQAIELTQRFPGSLGAIGRLTSAALRDTTQRRFFEIVDEITGGKPHKLIHKWLVGESHLWLKTPVPGVYSEILFKHLDDPGPLGSLDLDWWWIDECHEPDGGEVPENVFLLLQGRLRGKVGPLRGLITSNCGGKDWIWKWFFNDATRPPGYWGITVPTRENLANLPPNYEKNLRDTHPEEWVNRFLDCSFDVFEGMIFEEFLRKVHVLPHNEMPDPREGLIEMGFDFGVSAPTAVCKGIILPSQHIYIPEEFNKPEPDIRKVALWIKERKPLVIWSDPTVINKAVGGESPQKLYADLGVILTRAPSNDALLRISMIHSYLMQNKLFISERCVQLITSIETSRWAKIKKVGDPERPEKKEDHGRDSLAYFLMGHPLGSMLDPVNPGQRERKSSVIDGSGGWRHHSLDEDKDLDEEVLTDDQFYALYGVN